MFSLLMSYSLAATPREVAHVYYLLNSGRPAEAQSEATDSLNGDPEDLWMQVAWLYARVRGAPAAAAEVVATEQAWVALKPEDPVRRAALGFALMLQQTAKEPNSDWLPEKPGHWCDEVLPWFTPLPAAPEQGVRALSLRQQILHACEQDDAADRAELLAMVDVTPGRCRRRSGWGWMGQWRPPRFR